MQVKAVIGRAGSDDIASSSGGVRQRGNLQGDAQHQRAVVLVGNPNLQLRLSLPGFSGGDGDGQNKGGFAVFGVQRQGDALRKRRQVQARARVRSGGQRNAGNFPNRRDARRDRHDDGSLRLFGEHQIAQLHIRILSQVKRQDVQGEREKHRSAVQVADLRTGKRGRRGLGVGGIKPGQRQRYGVSSDVQGVFADAAGRVGQHVAFERERQVRQVAGISVNARHREDASVYSGAAGLVAIGKIQGVVKITQIRRVRRILRRGDNGGNRQGNAHLHRVASALEVRGAVQFRQHRQSHRAVLRDRVVLQNVNHPGAVVGVVGDEHFRRVKFNCVHHVADSRVRVVVGQHDLIADGAGISGQGVDFRVQLGQVGQRVGRGDVHPRGHRHRDGQGNFADEVGMRHSDADRVGSGGRRAVRVRAAQNRVAVGGPFNHKRNIASGGRRFALYGGGRQKSDHGGDCEFPAGRVESLRQNQGVQEVHAFVGSQRILRRGRHGADGHRHRNFRVPRAVAGGDNRELRGSGFAFGRQGVRHVQGHAVRVGVCPVGAAFAEVEVFGGVGRRPQGDSRVARLLRRPRRPKGDAADVSQRNRLQENAVVHRDGFAGRQFGRVADLQLEFKVRRAQESVAGSGGRQRVDGQFGDVFNRRGECDNAVRANVQFVRTARFGKDGVGVGSDGEVVQVARRAVCAFVRASGGNNNLRNRQRGNPHGQNLRQRRVVFARVDRQVHINADFASAGQGGGQENIGGARPPGKRQGKPLRLRVGQGQSGVRRGVLRQGGKVNFALITGGHHDNGRIQFGQSIGLRRQIDRQFKLQKKRAQQAVGGHLHCNSVCPDREQRVDGRIITSKIGHLAALNNHIQLINILVVSVDSGDCQGDIVRAVSLGENQRASEKSAGSEIDAFTRALVRRRKRAEDGDDGQFRRIASAHAVGAVGGNAYDAGRDGGG